MKQKQLPTCLHREGHFCLCYIPTGGKCNGLERTDFKNGVCPFFRDVRKMMSDDVRTYRTGAYLKRDGRSHSKE